MSKYTFLNFLHFFFFLIKCLFRPQLSSVALTNLQHLFFCIFSLIFLYQNLDNSEHVTQVTLEIDRGDFQSKTSEDQWQFSKDAETFFTVKFVPVLWACDHYGFALMNCK